MKWTKNGFSYFVWLIYALSVSVGLLGVGSVTATHMGYPFWYGILAGGIYVVLAGVLVLLFHKYVAEKCNVLTGKEMLPVILEGVVLVGLFVLGIYLRVSRMMSLDGEGADIVYFQAAMVAEGQSIPQVVHGATYIYLQLLHLSLLFLGNKLIAAVGLQVGLQLLAIVLIYVAVRKLSGRVAALVMAAFLLLSPNMLLNAVTLSPQNLFLLFFAIALCIVSSALTRKRGLGYLFAGLGIGICTYFDIMGIVLLLFLAGVFNLEYNKGAVSRYKRGQLFLTGLGSSFFCWIVVMSVDALCSEKKIFNVIAAWWELYKPGFFKLWFVGQEQGELIDILVLFCVLALGVFGFWCRSKSERVTIWVGATLVLVLLQGFQMTRTMDGSLYLYLFLSALAGIGIGDVFTKACLPKATCMEKGQEKAVKEENMNLEKNEVEKPKDEEKQEIHFLENPLPLPKKHEPKVLDYKLSDIGEDEDFDILVSEDEDFDFS